MKRYKIVSLILLMLTVLAIGAGYSFNYKSNALPKMSHSKNTGFAVVELFTSEGCSSCPPADEAVAELLSKQLENVYILCFHVDYWNKLGWKDPFSQSLFSARQGKYARVFSLESSYTPQVVVNGTSEFVGSNESRLNATVKNSLNTEAQSAISISTKKLSSTVTVTYNITGTDVVLLNLAFVQPEASTVVKKGENRGRTLHHVNIVRALHTADVKGAGNLTIDIPKSLTDVPLQLIAYTQSKQSFKVLGADQKKL